MLKAIEYPEQKQNKKRKDKKGSGGMGRGTERGRERGLSAQILRTVSAYEIIPNQFVFFRQ